MVCEGYSCAGRRNVNWEVRHAGELPSCGLSRGSAALLPAVLAKNMQARFSLRSSFVEP